MTLVFESCAEADLDDREIFFRQQLFCALDALLHQILLWCQPRRFSERTRKVELTEISYSRDLGETQIGIEIRLDEIFHTPQLISRKAAAHLWFCRTRCTVVRE